MRDDDDDSQQFPFFPDIEKSGYLHELWVKEGESLVIELNETERTSYTAYRICGQIGYKVIAIALVVQTGVQYDTSGWTYDQFNLY